MIRLTPTFGDSNSPDDTEYYVPEPEDDSSPDPAKPLCITPFCTRPVFARGVCNCCHEAAKRLVHSGESTDAELVSLGLLAPKQFAKKPNALVAEFRRKKAKAEGRITP